MIFSCQYWTANNGIQITKTKTKCVQRRLESSGRRHPYPLTSSSISSPAVFSVMQRSSLAGIWPEDWDDQMGICGWEGLSLTIRRPLIGGRDNWSTSDLYSQSRQQLRERKKRNNEIQRYSQKQMINSEHINILSCFVAYHFDLRVRCVLGNRRYSRQ